MDGWRNLLCFAVVEMKSVDFHFQANNTAHRTIENLGNQGKLQYN